MLAWYSHRVLPALVLVLVFTHSGIAEAHSLGSRGRISPPLKAYFEELRVFQRELPNGAIGVRGVLDQFKLWPENAPITMCFSGGEQALRAVFVQTSLQWTFGTSIKFDFGNAPAYRTCSDSNGSSIRVGFMPNENWSYIGTDSLRYPGLTLNVGYAGEASLNQLDRKELEHIILHELGHALGFEHEHQSPKAKCENEFDWPKVYEFARSQWGWAKPDGTVDKKAVDFNLRALASGERLRITPYDRQSIMHYYFEPKLFKRGQTSPCFVGHNYTLSQIDMQMVREAYPPQLAMQDDHLQQRANSASVTLSSLKLSSRQLSRVGRELTRVLAAAPRKVILDFDLARASGQSITRGPGDFEVCHETSPSSDNATVAVACEVATDASALVIAVEPK